MWDKYSTYTYPVAFQDYSARDFLPAFQVSPEVPNYSFR